jgi:hypothetical protein
VHAATEWGSAAVNWRLFLPESWDDAIVDSSTMDGATLAAQIRAGMQEIVRSSWPT